VSLIFHATLRISPFYECIFPLLLNIIHIFVQKKNTFPLCCFHQNAIETK
jgi:hypothetical protein